MAPRWSSSTELRRIALSCALLSACGAKTAPLVPEVEARRDSGTTAPPRERTSLGTEFFAVTTANSWLHERHFSFAITIGNPSDSPVHVTVDGGVLTEPLELVVPPASAVTQQLPWVRELAHNRTRTVECTPCCDWQCCQSIDSQPAISSLVAGGAYRIRASAPVSAYQFNPWESTLPDRCPRSSFTNDASLLLPVESLAADYLVLAHHAFQDRGSFVAIAAAAPGETIFTVRPTADIRAGTLPGAEVEAIRAGSERTFTLQRGDVLQLVSTAGSPGDVGFRPQDLTGTTIRADRPIAVWAGVDCAHMSWPDGALGACDHLEEQLLPEATWGLSAVVTQLRARGREERAITRVLSAADDNLITFRPARVHGQSVLARGAFLELESDASYEVRGTAPLLVAQFMEGEGAPPPSTMGDPSMVIEVPVEQHRDAYTFLVPATYNAHFVNVIATSGARVVLDGATLDGAEPIEDSSFVVFHRTISPGSHVVSTIDGSPIALKVYGVAEAVSYAYPGGLALRLLR